MAAPTGRYHALVRHGAAAGHGVACLGAEGEGILPEEPSQGSQQLGFAHYMRLQTERSEVAFSRGGVDYTVFDYTDHGHRRAGVRVTTADGSDHEVACDGPVDGRLDALGKSLCCDADNALNGGNCP